MKRKKLDPPREPAGTMTAARIRQLRGVLAASQEEFSRLVHAHWTTISKWERGHARPDAWQSQVLLTAWNHIFEEPARLEYARTMIEAGAPLRALAALLAPLDRRFRALLGETK